MLFIGTKPPKRLANPSVKMFTGNIKNGATNTFTCNIEMNRVVLEVFFLMISMMMTLIDVLLL
jgi:hypothetical protein